ncbi:Cell division cycle protein 27 -like protein [Toxocara canis]|uniref:Cell division cycle protein 27 homolog n=1 Tax=Toxocara canis TaxID=6265 RepID=A0A0B2UNM0_TOXCA|nr:Cell division cycle protein 27 -like protein [Toxocara canis]
MLLKVPVMMRMQSVADVIYCYLEFLAVDDAILLAELYNAQGEMDEAETVLRENAEPRLHTFFEGNTVEPFARALLARIFIESGRADEAKRENRRAMDQNIFSWSSIKTQCELGAARDVDEIYEQISRKISARQSGVKAKAATPDSSRQKSPEKSVKSDEKKTPIVNEAEQKISCFAPKKKTHISATRKMVHSSRHSSDAGSVETRRSTRLFPSSQDSENLSTVVAARELRASSRAQHPTLSTGTSSRTAHDKQLRSMNRINEMEVNSVAIKVHCPSPTSTPSIHKLIESPDSDSSAKPASPVARRTRSGSQSTASPLADKNAQLKDDVEMDAGPTISSNPQLSTSGEITTRTLSMLVGNDFRLDSGRCSSCASSLNPFTVTSLQANRPAWSDELMNLVECVCQVALMQSCLSRYKTKKVLERVSNMPTRCAVAPLVRELAARAYLERLEYGKSRELLESLHKQLPYRVSGMEVLSTVLWHAQEARQLSLLASELTESARMSAETWCVAGNCFSVQKQHDTAIECFERAISLNPRFAYAFSLLGHELLDTDQLDKAAAAFGRAVLLCPIDYRAWFGLGLMHFKREHLCLARSYLIRAVNINPYNSVVLCQLSVIEQALHNDTAAMDLLQRALKITPENAACRFYRARLLYEKHDYERCRDELNELKLYAHDEAQVFFLLGRVYKKLGNTHMALLNFSWAAEMDPRGEQSHNSLAEGPYDDEPSSD